MKTMMKLGLIAASALSLTAGAAAAQGWSNDYRRDEYRGDHWNTGSYERRLAMLDGRIEAGIRSGRLTRQEVWRLRAEFRQVAQRTDLYRSDGLSNWERADLDRRFARLSTQLRFEARDGERYGYGYGRDDYGDYRR